MSYFAVIDTETNWADAVMSISTVIADADTFQPVASKYHILIALPQLFSSHHRAMSAISSNGMG